jgi:hypothetical protein
MFFSVIHDFKDTLESCASSRIVRLGGSGIAKECEIRAHGHTAIY